MGGALLPRDRSDCPERAADDRNDSSGDFVARVSLNARCVCWVDDSSLLDDTPLGLASLSEYLSHDC